MKKKKYRNSPVVVGGVRFDSRAEAKRWGELQLLAAAGKIVSLERQVRYDFEINGERIGFYKADFRYWDKASNQEVVEDVKGVRTPVFAIKAKLMRALHRVEVIEIRSGR